MLRKIAVFSDVHGNITALDAVLKDAKQNEATDYWFLGDLFLPGPGANEIYEAIANVSPSVWLQGNWEQEINGVVKGENVRHDPSNVYFARLTEYLISNLKQSYFQEIIKKPISTKINVNGLDFGLSHNQADRSTGHDLFPAESQSNFDHLAQDHDVVLYGHTHQQVMRTSSEGQLIVNPGATGQPYSPYAKFMSDQRACYTILTVEDGGNLSVDFRKVPYDVSEEIALAKSKQLPYLELYKHLRETGYTSTHDEEVLDKYNRKFNYQKDIIEFFNHKSSD